MATLVQNLNDLTVRVATEFKGVYAKQGNLTSLSTTNKDSLVAAINELYAGGGAGSTGPVINDTTPSGTSVYSSSKTQSIVDAKPSIDDAVTNGTTVWSGSKVNSAINTAVATKPSINDTTAGTTTVYSSSKTDQQISAAVSSLVDSSPAALDTLNELAAALGDDPNFATTINTSLGNRVRVDAVQTFTEGQKTQGRANLGVTASSDIGPTDTNFVTLFESSLL